MEREAAGAAELVRAKVETMGRLGITGGMEDIQVSLSDSLQIIAPLGDGDECGLLILDRSANLALARMRFARIRAEA